MKKLYLLASLMIILLFSACSGIKPEVMKNYLQVQTPTDLKTKTPVVFFFQGSGGSNVRAYKWRKWFKEQGVATVVIDNAGVRNLNRLYGVNYGSDLASALDALKTNKNLDLNKYAVMGFSRGGTAALESNSFLKEEQSKPDFVFALYPGDTNGCPNSHEDKTLVHIFYGDLDDWGTYKGIRNTCKSTASWYDNATFHLLKDAHHGYDGDYDNTWTCCSGKSFRTISSEDALQETKSIILEALNKKWKIKKTNE